MSVVLGWIGERVSISALDPRRTGVDFFLLLVVIVSVSPSWVKWLRKSPDSQMD